MQSLLPQTLTEGLAVYAAVLSTVVFVWNIVNARGRVRVKLSYGLDETSEGFKSGVFIFVQNPSSKPVHISNISVLYPYKQPSLKEIALHALRYRRLPLRLGWVSSALEFQGVKDGCPVSVEPGKAHRVFLTDEVLDDMLKDSVRRELIAVAQDQLWNDTYSAALPITERTNEKRT